MKIGWISGWAVPPSWVEMTAAAAMPQHTHVAVPAEINAAKSLIASDTCDAFAGYSLGALLWLNAAAVLPKGKKVFLLAPILGFCAEKNKGGTTRATQLRFLKKWLLRQRAAALRDFYRRADLPDFSTRKDWDTAALLEGLTLLERLEGSAQPSANFIGYAGGNDPLTQAAILQKNWPSLTVLPEATHALDSLLKALPADAFDNAIV